jgi:hypothetical protein
LYLARTVPTSYSVEHPLHWPHVRWHILFTNHMFWRTSNYLNSFFEEHPLQWRYF